MERKVDVQLAEAWAAYQVARATETPHYTTDAHWPLRDILAGKIAELASIDQLKAEGIVDAYLFDISPTAPLSLSDVLDWMDMEIREQRVAPRR